jgi:hypothetical protein
MCCGGSGHSGVNQSNGGNVTRSGKKWKIIFIYKKKKVYSYNNK